MIEMLCIVVAQVTLLFTTFVLIIVTPLVRAKPPAQRRARPPTVRLPTNSRIKVRVAVSAVSLTKASPLVSSVPLCDTDRSRLTSLAMVNVVGQPGLCVSVPVPRLLRSSLLSLLLIAMVLSPRRCPLRYELLPVIRRKSPIVLVTKLLVLVAVLTVLVLISVGALTRPFEIT